MAALLNIPPEVEEVAATFGFKRWRILSRITIPLAAPGIAAGG
ncbi:MAG TPA: ABC transporter permease subunit, partial [Thermosynergistes sp.]|nr:ABC transporter permease subunit [Thermosynergistes sp.]